MGGQAIIAGNTFAANGYDGAEAVNVKAGWLGENSTEVFKFCDENNNNDK